MTLKYRIRYIRIAEDECTAGDATKTFKLFSDGNSIERPGRFSLLDLAKRFLINKGINFHKIRAIALKKINDSTIKNEYYVYDYRCKESYYSRPNLMVERGVR